MSTVDLALLREPGAEFATGAIYSRHARELQKFGERGRQNCRQDMLYHIDYLQGAIDGNDPGIFIQYALWLKGVLISRGVPAAHLSTSFEFLESFFGNNLNPEGARAVAEILSKARAELMLESPPVVYGQNRYPALPQTEQYRLSVLAGQHKLALSLMLQAMDEGASLTQAAVKLVQPAMYQIGSLWQNNQITVSQEHLATAITQNVLASAYMKAVFAPSVGKSAMFACVEGNHHAMGLRIIADAFETAGWDVFFLGANLPMGDLVREVDARRPQLLALSISLPCHISAARTTIALLRSELGGACPQIWVGGLASLYTPKIWRITGADGWSADALHALEQL